MKSVAENLKTVRERMDAAARQAGRDPAAIKLLGVGKFQSVAAVQEAYAAGLRTFGENRVQEAQAKYTELRAQYPDLRLHLIGALQTNKVAAAVALFDVIATLDRVKLAQALAAEMRKQGRRPELLIEINIGREPQKAGIMPEALPEFLRLCRDDLDLPVRGLMCIPPQGQAPAPYFRQLADLADNHDLPERSMGMSGDFESAIMCGATEVRVGTTLFGGRRVP
ncbi:MAG: YggS family pyridoxal phosphate-dependent enzyme [Alphaproteobacteria bacterium]